MFETVRKTIVNFTIDSRITQGVVKLSTIVRRLQYGTILPQSLLKQHVPGPAFNVDNTMAVGVSLVVCCAMLLRRCVAYTDLPRKYVPVSMLVWQALEQIGRLIRSQEQEAYTQEHYEA